MAGRKMTWGKVWSALAVVVLTAGLMVGFSRVALAACTGHTKCGVKEPLLNDCPGDAYDTIGCDEVGGACYAMSCGGGVGCEKGNTCDVDSESGGACESLSQPSCGGGTCPNGKTCVGVGSQGLCGCSNSPSGGAG